MVLADFTLAERWRVFGELSFAPVPRDAGARLRPLPCRQLRRR